MRWRIGALMSCGNTAAAVGASPNPPALMNKFASGWRGLIFSAIGKNNELARWAGSYRGLRR